MGSWSSTGVNRGDETKPFSENKESRYKAQVTPLPLPVMVECFEGGTVQNIVDPCKGDDLTTDLPDELHLHSTTACNVSQ
jgi:hypothetical protein